MRKINLFAVAASFAAGSLLLFTATPTGIVPRVHASEGCSLGTLHGNYAGVWSGLLFSGSTPPASPQNVTAFQPYDAMEVSNFDGLGDFSSTVTAAVGGTSAQSFPDTGTYTVNANCTGSLTLASGLTFDFIVLRDAKELKFAETDGNIGAITETRLGEEEK